MGAHLTILHLSDTHFGMPDSTGEQPRIASDLVDTIKSNNLDPDIIIFSGDLTYSGQAEQFLIGKTWLKEVIRACKSSPALYILPGNHDSNWAAANGPFLKQASSSEAAFLALREHLSKDIGHLNNFSDWHKQSSIELNTASDWSISWGFSHSVSFSGVSCRVIGLNSAILSHSPHDEGSLVIDPRTLNDSLIRTSDAQELIIAISHHPFDSLTEWNRSKITELLSQETGAHLFLHGHNHKQIGATFGQTTGQSLSTLSAGAAYPGDRWPLYFAYYDIDFSSRELASRVFAFNRDVGRWLPNAQLSRPLIVRVPRAPESTGRDGYRAVAEDKNPPAVALPKASHEQLSGTPSAPLAEPAQESQNHRDVEHDALLLINEVRPLFQRVQTFLDLCNDESWPNHKFYGRIKSVDSIVRKVKGKHDDGDRYYTVKHLDDACGFRYVTLFQSDVTGIVDRLRDIIYPDKAAAGNPFVKRRLKVTIHTYRPLKDPLSNVELITQKFESWEAVDLEVRTGRTGYSSVHIVAHAGGASGKSGAPAFPIEFQIRHELEEVWSRVDSTLRYETNRGTVGENAWERHLNVLKSQFDAMIQYVEVIKDTVDSERRSIASEKVEAGAADEKKKSLSTKERQLVKLRKLPKKLYQRVMSAFDLWEQANEGHRFGGSALEFRKAADAFVEFTDGCPAVVQDVELSATLGYISSMERAFMLRCAGEARDLELAREIYVSRLETGENDITARFRLGQVLSSLQRFDESERLFLGTIALMESGMGTDLDGARDYVEDFTRLNLAILYFRYFGVAGRNIEDKLEYIRRALHYSGAVLEKGSTQEGRAQALNDYLYYAWEERKTCSDSGITVTVSNEYFVELCGLLNSELGNLQAGTFRDLDTLARCMNEVGNHAGAKEAAKAVCLRLEEAAQKRSQGVLGNVSDRFRPVWAIAVYKYLVNEDERDSFGFALDLLGSGGG